MEIGVDFKNILSYNEHMAKGMDDKLFFLNKINFKKDGYYLFVDFGCADGTLLDTLYGIMEKAGINNVYYIGYDISDTMIELAKTKFSHFTSSVMFTTSWDEVKEKVKTYSAMESVLILSSVIHEIYSYAECEDDINLFWHRVLDTGFKYICVRDMMVSKNINHKNEIDVFEFMEENIPHFSDRRKYFQSFTDKWGSIYDNKNFIHYLLKYRWTINWDRELNENYLPIYVEDFLKMFRNSYTVSYLERFRVPFLEKCWKEDFNIEINDYTHIKTILEINKV